MPIPQAFRAINMYPHTHLNLPSLVETTPVLLTISQENVDEKKVKKEDKNIWSRLANKPESHESKPQITMNQALMEQRD